MDDNRDKEVMRNQLIGVILVTLLLVVWFKWFMPAPPPQKAAPPAPQTTEAPVQHQAPGSDLSLAAPATVAAPDLASGLPAVPEVADPAADEVILQNGELELVFTRIGARLKRASVVVGNGDDEHVQLVPPSEKPDTESLYPLGVVFTDKDLGDEVNRRRFDVEQDPSGRSVKFSLSIAGKALLRKTFSLPEKGHILGVSVDYQNLSQEQQVVGLDQTPAYFLDWSPSLQDPGEQKDQSGRQAIMWFKEKDPEELYTSSLEPSSDGTQFAQTINVPKWVAVKNAYFLAAMKPEFETPQAMIKGTTKRFRIGVAVPRFEIGPQAVQTNNFSVYVGPSEQRALAQSWDTLPKVLRFFGPTWWWMDWFAKQLLRMLNWFHDSVIANYGLAIIFLTIVVRIAMYPLTLKSMRSMKKMQLLGPEMEELKAKHGENPQELQQKMMELYKERGVNPLGGCFPMLLQMPIFIALYRMLWYAYELRGAPFYLWMTDLSQPDHLFHMPWMRQVPFVGPMFEYFNLLPILMALAMVVSQKLTPATATMQNQQQKVMMTIMPVFFSLMCYSMASGLNLYILTSTVLGIVQQQFTSAGNVEAKPKKKVLGKKQHFYTAAKARQREAAREAKKERKHKP